MKTNNETGFSLIELVVVIGIIMVIAAIAAPKITGLMEGVRLRGMVTDVNGLVQQDRIQSVRDNKSYTIKTVAAAGVNGIVLYVDTDNSGTADAGEPAIQLPTDVAVNAAGPGVLPPGVVIPPYVSAATVTLSFNERGLPCSNPPVCNTISPYVIYFAQTRPSGTNGWAAITVTQSGRIKAYTYTGTAWQ
jgi:Tfp pilus assembly protein FimT